MISLTLFRKEWKSNWGFLLIFSGILTIYAGMIVYMYDPTFGESLQVMVDSMPEMFAAFGMGNPATTLLEFVINYLYGFLLLVFPAVFTILLANRLVVKYVEDGSMAYLLSTPKKRIQIILTQLLFLLMGIFVLIAYVTILVIVMAEILFKGELEIGRFIYLNWGLLRLHFFFGGVCFLASCICSDSRKSGMIGAGVLIYSLLVQMISQVGETFEGLKYITPLTLFDPEGLVAFEQNAVSGVTVFGIIGALLFVIGVVRFCNKDLSI